MNQLLRRFTMPLRSPNAKQPPLAIKQMIDSPSTTIKAPKSPSRTQFTIAPCAEDVVTEKQRQTKKSAALVPVKKRSHLFARTTHEPKGAAIGLASYYTDGSRTASGEKFIPGELTAAHPTLPFGTLLRVTRLDTNRSVIVRVNDRGPFAKGRIVDVSHFAAEQLGLTQRGVAKVKIDVVR